MQMKNLSNPIFTAIVSLNKPKNYEQLIPNQPYCKSEGLFRFQHANLSLKARLQPFTVLFSFSAIFVCFIDAQIHSFFRVNMSGFERQ